MQLSLIKYIKVVWLYEGEIYLYENVPRSIVANSKAVSVRFELKDLYEEDDNFEVIIKRDGNSYVFKTDYYEDSGSMFPLRAFVAKDEVIFYHEGSEGHIYFHLYNSGS